MKNVGFNVIQLFFILDIIIPKMDLLCSYVVTEHNVTYTN